MFMKQAALVRFWFCSQNVAYSWQAMVYGHAYRATRIMALELHLPHRLSIMHYVHLSSPWWGQLFGRRRQANKQGLFSINPTPKSTKPISWQQMYYWAISAQTSRST